MPTTEICLPPATLLGFPLPLPGPDGLPEADRDKLVGALQRVDMPWAKLAEHIRYSPTGYGRIRLYRDAVWEMLLLSWLPGQQTPIHDHGSSWGATLILAGALVEERFRFNGHQGLDRFQERTAQPSEVLVETLDVIHRLSNRSKAPALSLHLYTQPLWDPNLYDEATGRKLAWQL